MSHLSITVIQTDLHWEDKRSNLAMLERKILGIRDKTEIVVLPEMFSTGFSMDAEKLAESMDGETVSWMKKVAATKKIILTGSIIIRSNVPGGAEKTDYFNRLIWMLPNGEFGYYDKRHRFAYAGEDEKFSPGSKRLIASVKGWKINLLVCYDLRFPVWSRQNIKEAENQSEKEPEYDAIIYVANWPERRNNAWKTLLPARAIENQCYVIGVNRVGNDGHNIYHSGDSMIIDPMGEILYHNKDDEEVFTIVLDKTHLQSIRQKFPFWKDADRFTLL